MAPVCELNSPWVWQYKNGVRVKLMLGNSIVEGMARRAIEKKYDLKMTKYSKYWDIAPLMIDSTDSLRCAIHPNSLVMVFRFKCSPQEQAQKIAKLLAEGEYEIEVAFYLASFRQMSTNFVSITCDQMKAVAATAAADGGNTNVPKRIYSESADFKPEVHSAGMEETFISLMKQDES